MAADINSVVLVGRLTRDIEIRYTPNGIPVGKIGLANSRRAKKGDTWVDETNFFDVTLFGKSAESLAPYLTKGQQICIQGELRFESWEKDGQKSSRVVIIANNLQLLGSRQQQNTDYNSNQVENHYAKPSQTNSSESIPKSNTFDEDIPF